MQQSFVIRKSVFVSLIGTVIALCVCTVFLLKGKAKFKDQARQLIIQNDSIMSANIVLMDSLKNRLSSSGSKGSSLVFKSSQPK
jgi:predicted PurR-regulated permease PerM